MIAHIILHTMTRKRHTNKCSDIFVSPWRQPRDVFYFGFHGGSELEFERQLFKLRPLREGDFSVNSAI